MALVGELATRSNEVRTWWGGHTVRTHATGTKRVNHPVVGEITLAFGTPVVPCSGVVIATCLTEPGSPSADALDLLRSWAASRVGARS